MLTESDKITPYWLSIVIPFYNVEKYIGELLNSVVDGISGKVEIILIDDGSTDRSRHIVSEYEQLIDTVLISQANSGQGAARNIGVNTARGEYVYFLDGDDRIVPEFCKKIHTRLAADGWPDVLLFSASVFHDRDVVATAYDRAYERGIERCCISQREAVRLLMEREAFFVSPCCYVFRRSVWRRHRLSFPDGRYEDEMLFLRLMLCAGTVSISKNEWFERRVRTGSTMAAPMNETHVRARHRNLRLTMETLGSSLVDRTRYGRATRKYLCSVTIVYVQSARKTGEPLDWRLICEATVQMRSASLQLRLMSHMLPLQRVFRALRQLARKALS